MRLGLAALVAGTVLFQGCAAPDAKHAEIRQALVVPTGKDAKPIQFRKVVVRLRRGEPFGQATGGILCIPQPGGQLTWQGGRVTISNDDFTDVFREELEKNGYPVVGNPDALFDDPSEWKAELLVAGIVRKMEANLCFPMSGYGNFRLSKGSAWIKVDWQIFSRLDRKVVYEVSTEGSHKSDEQKEGNAGDILLTAFSVAVQNLLADQQFHRLVLREQAPTRAGGSSTQLMLARVSASTRSIGDAMNDLRPGVVTVFAGRGHGSGFFLTRDGYLLTNEHVVREAKYVKVRLITGREVVGEVLRTDSRRDVALIKVEEAGMSALPIRRGEPAIGEDVYAMGTPLDPKLSTTVSRGIVSAYRSEEGQKLIQSDVTILPGNSGGPLLDRNGNVVGIAVSGAVYGNAMAGVNFFVPITDAFAALNLQ